MKIGETLRAENRQAFRAWLDTFHQTKPEIWLEIFKAASGVPSVTLREAQEEAVCFGWVDGQMSGASERSYFLRFTPRRSGSNWSKTNRERALRMLAEGKVMPAGAAAFPADLHAGLEAHSPRHPEDEPYETWPDWIRAGLERDPDLKMKFLAEPRSVQRQYLLGLVAAKREETRQARLEEILDALRRGERLDPMRKAPRSTPNSAS